MKYDTNYYPKLYFRSRLSGKEMKRVIRVDGETLYSNILTFNRLRLVSSLFLVFSIKTTSLFIVDVIFLIT